MEKWIQSRFGSLQRLEASVPIMSYFCLFVRLLFTFNLQLCQHKRFPHLCFLFLFSACTRSSSQIFDHVAPLQGMRFTQDGETFYHCDRSRRQLFPINQVWEELRSFYPGVQRLNRQNGAFSRLPPGGISKLFLCLKFLLTDLIIQSISQTLILEISRLTFSIYCQLLNFHFKSF